MLSLSPSLFKLIKHTLSGCHALPCYNWDAFTKVDESLPLTDTSTTCMHAYLRDPTVGSLISAAHLPHGLCLTPLNVLCFPLDTTGDLSVVLLPPGVAASCMHKRSVRRSVTARLKNAAFSDHCHIAKTRFHLRRDKYQGRHTASEVSCCFDLGQIYKKQLLLEGQDCRPYRHMVYYQDLGQHAT